MIYCALRHLNFAFLATLREIDLREIKELSTFWISNALAFMNSNKTRNNVSKKVEK